MSLQRAQADTPFKPSASTWNAFVDAAQREQLPHDEGSRQWPPGLAWLHNESADTAIPRFGWAEITGPTKPHSEDEDHGDGVSPSFDELPHVNGSPITLADGPGIPGAYCVAQNQIKPLATGLVVVRGLTWATYHQASSGTGDGRFLTPSGGTPPFTRAMRASSGPGRILFAAGDTAVGATDEIAFISLEDLPPNRCVIVCEPGSYWDADGVDDGFQFLRNPISNPVPDAHGLWVFPYAFQGQIANDAGVVFDVNTLPDDYLNPCVELRAHTRYRLTCHTVWRLNSLTEYEAEELLAEYWGSHTHGYDNNGTPDTTDQVLGQYFRSIIDHDVTVATEIFFDASPAGFMGQSTLSIFRNSIGPSYAHSARYACHSGVMLIGPVTGSGTHIRARVYRTVGGPQALGAQLYSFQMTIEQTDL